MPTISSASSSLAASSSCSTICIYEIASSGFRSYTGDATGLRWRLTTVLQEERGSIPATAKRFAVAQGTIYRWLRDLGLPTPHYTRSKSRHNRPRAAARDREIVVSPEAEA